MQTSAIPVFDAHLDLAYLAVNRRDMLAPLSALAAEPGLVGSTGNPPAPLHPPAAITLHALRHSPVRFALATIFTEPVDSPQERDAPEKYLAPDVDDAHRAGRAQLEVYLDWAERGHIQIDLRRSLHVDRGTGEVRGGMGVSEAVPPSPSRLVERALARDAAGWVPSMPPGIVSDRSVSALPPLHVGVLIENADPIRSPEELGWWKERGVVAIGLAWAKASRYAGGNSTDLGVSPLGKELVREMDRLRIVHDVSHLSERAFDELLSLTARPVVASHSNCRALLGGENAANRQRHLTDAQIRAIASRGGVIGLNLFAQFVRSGLEGAQRPSIDDAIAHVEHVCSLTGSRAHVGLGSDMDGGLSAARLPDGIDSPADLPKLLGALARRGWSDRDLRGFACENWVRSLAAAMNA